MAWVLSLTLWANVCPSGAATAPSIFLQPRHWTAFEGTSHTFEVGAIGDAPLGFQWRFNESPLSGQTSSNLALVNIQASDVGGYSVVVTNLFGAVTSVVANLTVRSLNDPAYASPNGGWTYLYSGNAAANPSTAALDGTWNHNNSADSWKGDGRGPGNDILGGIGTANGILTLEDAVDSGTSSSDNRRYTLTHDLAQDAGVTNASTLLDDGITLSFRARLTPPAPADPLTELPTAPNGYVNALDGRGMFGLRQAGRSGMILSFSLNQATEETGTSTSYSFGQAGLHMNNLNGSSRSTFVDPGEPGTVNLLPLDPTVFHEFWITIQRSGTNPGTHQVTIYLDGSLTPTVFYATAGTAFDGSSANTNYLVLALPSTGQRGAVDVDFFGYKSGVTPPAGFNDPVGFNLQPASASGLTVGGTATFSCGVTGTPPYALQWFRNGTAIPDATNATYTTPPAELSDNGAQFWVVAANSFSAATSGPALLQFGSAPMIIAQPQSLIVTQGDNASFSVSADAGPSPAFQWRFNASPISAATNSILEIGPAGPDNAGNYDVIVQNSSGSATSLVATLTVRTLDFGDAPLPYPTTKTSDGARHVIVPGVQLGGVLDSELDGTPDSLAAGDDLTGSDDEDGVQFTTLLFPGQTASIQVVASVNGRLDAWIDFNSNGSWMDAEDGVFASQSLTAGTNLLTFAVPANAAAGNTFARFRFSTTGGLAPTGAAADGEVEDYEVSITPLANLSVQANESADPVATGSALTYTVTVANTGPSTATSVGLTVNLPGSVTFVSANSSQGSCVHSGGTITCSLGSLITSASAIVTVAVTPTASGLLSLSMVTGASESDPAPGNNALTVTTTVEDPPVLISQPQNLTVTNSSAAAFAVGVSGSAPLRFQWYFNSSPIVGATSAALVLSNAQPVNAGSYSVSVSNRVGGVVSVPATLVVLVPPTITSQPQSRTNSAGSTVALAVGATGTAPLSYQWSFNSTAVPGATNPALVLPNAQASNSGVYVVVVSNAAGVTSSVPAALTVVEYDFGDAPNSYPTLMSNDGARHRIVPGVYLGSRIDFEPDGLADSVAAGDDLDRMDDEDGVTLGTPMLVGQTVSCMVVASTNGLLNAWMDFNRNGSWAEKGEQVFTNRALAQGTNNLTIQVPTTAVPGASFARFRFNSAGGLSPAGEAFNGEVEDYPVTIAPAVDLAANMTAQATLATGSNLTYTIDVTNRGPGTASGVTLADALPGGVVFSSAVASQGGCSLAAGTVTCALGSLAAGGSAAVTLRVVPIVPGIITNSATVGASEAEPLQGDNTAQAITLVQDYPVISMQPQHQTVINGDTATFSVQASGSDLSYHWRFGGSDLVGKTNATLILTNVQTNQAGSYSVRITNRIGSVLSAAATLTVRVRVVITAPPQSLTVTQGNLATFRVTAAGTAPLSYQWSLNGGDLPGAIADTLALSNVQPAQAGAYRVRVSNEFSSSTSDPATLTVIAPPLILTPPQSRTNFAGSDATFTVGAMGTDLRYQWYYNTIVALAGGTNASLVVTNVQKTQAGAYSVVVSNMVGQATSASAGLAVVEADFGDAPDPYSTRLAANGAYHVIVSGIHLGARVDFEPDGLPDAASQGDDLNGLDDEDGVIFPNPLFVGQTGMVQVIASTNGFLDAWIDFTGNGFWYDDAEQIFASVALGTGTNTLTFSVPATARLGEVQARFRFSTAGGLSYEGAAPDGEVEDYRVTVSPAADVGFARVEAPIGAGLGSLFNYTITVTNLGPSFATGVTLTNVLPATVTFASAVASQGSCVHAAGRVTCTLGTLGAGSNAVVTIGVVANQTGPITNHVNVAAVSMDLRLDNNAQSQMTTVFAGPSTFSNPARIEVRDNTSANPYPSTVRVSGVTAAVYKVTVTLAGLTHSFASDLDVLLVGPRGQATMLMSDAGGGNPVNSATITFDDEATLNLPNVGRINSLTYRPSNYAGPDTDRFLAPAPAGPYVSTLSVFQGTDPNGTWSLFVMDNSAGDAGAITEGWSLSVSTLTPVADLAVNATDAPDPVSIGGNLTYAVTVTNRGPSSATSVMLSNILPANASFISATPSQGSCSNIQGTLLCSLGIIPPGAIATVSLAVQPLGSNMVSASFGVGARETDSILSNNTTTAMTTVSSLVDLALRHTVWPAVAVVGGPVTHLIEVTNRQATSASEVSVNVSLPPDVRFVSAVAGQGHCSATGGVVTCQLGSLPNGISAGLTVVCTPLQAGVLVFAAAAASSQTDANPADNSTTQSVPCHGSFGPFGSGDPILVPPVGAATPYPATILVSGLTAAVDRVSVTLSNLNHASAANLDILLVSPEGRAVLLMSDAGGNGSVAGATISFDDDATSGLPASSGLVSGFFKPTDYDPASDLFPAPAPGGPYSTQLSALRGSDPNGVWSLFVQDDQSPGSGSLAGWSLRIAVAEPRAGLAITGSASPLVAVGTIWTSVLTIINRGPSDATGVSLTSTLPAGLTFISANSSQGSCSNVAGEVRCALGTIARGGSMGVTLTTLPLATGSVSLTAVVAADQTDGEPSDNEAMVEGWAEDPPAVITEPEPMSVLLGDPVAFSVSASGAAPLQYQWLHDGEELPGATNDTLHISAATRADRGVYAVRVNNRVAATLSREVLLQVLTPPTLVAPPNQVIGRSSTSLPIPFTVGDDDTPAAELVVTGWATVPTLVPASGLVFGGSGSDRTVTITPTPGRVGSTYIILRVTDHDGAFASEPFALQVVVTNFPPTISPIAAQSAKRDRSIPPIPFTVGDAESPASSLVVTAESFDPFLLPLPPESLALSGTNGERILTVTPPTNWWGDVTITLTVQDPQGAVTSTQFDLSVVFVNYPPVVGALADQTVLEDTQVGPLPFVTDDLDTPPPALVVVSESSNAELAPPSQFVIVGGIVTSMRSLTLQPAANQSGVATITTVVTDGQELSTSNQFVLTVLPVNDAPTLDPISNRQVPANAGEQRVSLSGITSGAPNEAQVLTVSAVSSNPSLIPNPVVEYTSPGSTGTLKFQAVSNAVGRAEVTVTVLDDGDTLNGGVNALSQTFTINVGMTIPLTLRIDRDGGNVILSFDSESTKTYAIEFKNSLSDSTWGTLATLPGSGAVLTVADLVRDASQRIYRLSLR